MELKRINHYGDVEIFQYDPDNADLVQKIFMDNFDERIQDIICFCLEDIVDDQIKTMEDLLKKEYASNTSRGEPICGYSATTELGTNQSLEQLFTRYRHIWNDYLFIESTNLSLDQLDRFDKLKNSIKTVDEFLFRTVRLCGWGGYQFFHMYSFCKRLSAGRMKDFYNCTDEVRSWFIPD